MKKGGKKTMSLNQLAANRRNALQSTGPKTVAGKAIAKMNAMKHGLLAREVIVQGMSYKESPREFQAYRERFWRELSPVGPLEEALVDEMVTNRWRHRRALIAEAGEISLSVDNAWWQRKNAPSVTQWTIWIQSADMTAAMEKSADGVFYLMHTLEKLRDDVTQDGQLTEDTFNRVLDLFAGKPNHITHQLAAFCNIMKENPATLDAAALLAQHRGLVLDYIENELRTLSRRFEELDEREEKVAAARQSASVLPPIEKLDKILRYETALDRQFYRAMNQLERLQRMRSGEQVPPPLTMEVSPK